MNRTDRLIKILPSWLEVNSIKEIILCDWSSYPPVYDNPEIRNIINFYKKIKIIRLGGEEFYYRCHALNLAYQFTNKENPYLLKIDADYLNLNFNDNLINKYVKDTNILNKNYVIGGEFPKAKEEVGLLFLNKKFFENENGYNENFESSWGFEDIDLYRRLGMFQHLKRLDIENIKDVIYHIPHDDILRFKHQKIKMRDSNKDLSERFKRWENQKYNIIHEEKNYIEVIKCIKNTTIN